LVVTTRRVAGSAVTVMGSLVTEDRPVELTDRASLPARGQRESEKVATPLPPWRQRAPQRVPDASATVTIPLKAVSHLAGASSTDTTRPKGCPR